MNQIPDSWIGVEAILIHKKGNYKSQQLQTHKPVVTNIQTVHKDNH